MLPPPPTSSLFPYTTLFRSPITAPSSSSQCSPNPACPPMTTFLPTIHEPENPTCAATTVCAPIWQLWPMRSEEHTSELQSLRHLVCRLLLEKKKNEKTPSQA